MDTDSGYGQYTILGIVYFPHWLIQSMAGVLAFGKRMKAIS